MPELTDRQRQIVDCAIDIIAERGLASMTMRKLSERLGITEPAIYRHFENKTAILTALLGVLESETYERLPLDDQATPDAIIAHFDRLFTLFTNRPALATVVSLDDLADTDPELRVQVRRLLHENHRRLSRAIAAAMQLERVGAPEDAEYLATLLLGGVRLLVREWRLDGCSWDLRARGTRLVATLTKR